MKLVKINITISETHRCFSNFGQIAISKYIWKNNYTVFPPFQVFKNH